MDCVSSQITHTMPIDRLSPFLRGGLTVTEMGAHNRLSSALGLSVGHAFNRCPRRCNSLSIVS